MREFYALISNTKTTNLLILYDLKDLMGNISSIMTKHSGVNVGYTAFLISVLELFYNFDFNLLMLYSSMQPLYFNSMSPASVKHWKYHAGWNHFGSIFQEIQTDAMMANTGTEKSFLFNYIYCPYPSETHRQPIITDQVVWSTQSHISLKIFGICRPVTDRFNFLGFPFKVNMSNNFSPVLRISHDSYSST